MSASPYMILLLAFFVAGFFLILAIFLMKHFFEGRGKDESSVRVGELIQSLHKEISELKSAQEEEGKKVYKELAHSFTRAHETLQSGLEGGIKSVVENISAMSGAINEHLKVSQKGMNEQLGMTQKNISQQLAGTVKLIGDVRTTLGGLSESAKRMEALGEDISKLQDILGPPKLRGGIGEMMLENMLSQVIPSENYHLQYAFRSGERVDAVVNLGDQMIPIDSKFPMESFTRLNRGDAGGEGPKERRDFVNSVKRKIDDIASKYIKPEEGTYDFAMMYIPAENVYYEMMLRDEKGEKGYGLYEYALNKKVVPVSPSSFYAYLLAVAYGLKGFKIEREALEIRGNLEEISRNLEKFGILFDGVGKNIELAGRKYEESRRRFEKIEMKVASMTGLESHELDPGDENMQIEDRE